MLQSQQPYLKPNRQWKGKFIWAKGDGGQADNHDKGLEIRQI